MVDILPISGPANLSLMLTPGPEISLLEQNLKMESYVPASPESPITPPQSRRKMSIPTRSPAKASSGGPGIVFNFQIATASAQDSDMIGFASPMVSSNNQVRTAATSTRALAFVDTPPASDTEDIDSDLTEEHPHKRHKKEKSPPIISRHSGLKKECGACATKKTPYWRDGWDKSVILCNACGIRYQKYRARCSQCNYIPRKEEKLAGDCTHCGGVFI